MTPKIGFLHTAEAHVHTFDRLVWELDKSLTVYHEVHPELLERSLVEGSGPEVRQLTITALRSLVDEGCTAVSCTCSTLGVIAENQVIDGVTVQRIDRAAADLLMGFDRVLVVAAIESAAIAADSLLEQSASDAASPARWLVALAPNAWAYFKSGQTQEYEKSVADFANQLGGDYDAVFLSQASMAGAVRHCVHPRVITSPRVGVQRLLEMAGS